eukprot:505818_1
MQHKPHIVLVDGYIHQIKKLFDNKRIEININVIIYKYYHINKLFYYLQLKKDTFVGVYNFYIADIDNNKSYKCEAPPNEHFIKPINKDKLPTAPQKSDSDPCIALNFELPTNIKDWIIENDNNNYKKDTYNVIFQCGGMPNFTSCYGMIINETKLYRSDKLENDFMVYHWELPYTNKNFMCCSCSFSNKYGLFVNGTGAGDDGILQHLSFNNLHYDINDKWKWNNLKPRTHLGEYPASIIIEDIDKMIVSAGSGLINDKTVVIYDILKDDWTKMVDCNFEKFRVGLYHDKNTNNIFIAGYANGIIEYCDINKNNKWINLPETNNDRWFYPNIWCDDNNHNILNITDKSYQKIETIDLRNNDNKWIITNNDIANNLFNTEMKFFYNGHSPWLFIT